MLVDQRRQGRKDGLVRATLQPHPSDRRLHQEVPHQFVSVGSSRLRLDSRRWMGHLDDQPVSVRERGRIAHHKRARRGVPQQSDRFLAADGRLVPVLGRIAGEFHKLGRHLLGFAVGVRGRRVAPGRVARHRFVLVLDELFLGALAGEEVLAVVRWERLAGMLAKAWVDNVQTV